MSDHALPVYGKQSMLAALQRLCRYCHINISDDALLTVTQRSQQESIGQLVNDTRTVTAGDIFCAVIGSQRDGRIYVEQAIAAGCCLVLQETEQQTEHGSLTLHTSGVAIVDIFALNHELFAIAKAYYNAPQQQLNIIGITGTNGKTSTSQIVANLLDACGRNCAVIGTTGAGKLSALTTIENTTPGATELHSLFAKFVEQGITDVAMEVSSHALEQRRVLANLFNSAAFTNLSRDHLDYHQTMANYAAAKQQIFTGDDKQKAIINGDDQQAKAWLSNWPSQQALIVYGTEQSIKSYQQFVFAENIQLSKSGMQFTLVTHIGTVEINSQLLGRFNVENLLAAISTLLINDIALTDIAKAITNLEPIIGRMEAFHGQGKVTAVVDYAHTPDALISALQACRQHCAGKLWLVFGCGGERDQGKRALMAQAAQQYADKLVVTNDNPRNEPAEHIIADIVNALSEPEAATVIIDRKSAILTALSQAGADDLVLCAGKGHEDYIIIGAEKLPYNERAVVREFYQAKVNL